MKRVYAAVGLLILLLLVMWASNWLVKDTNETLLASLTLIEQQCTAGDFQGAQHSIARLTEYYYTREHFLALFIKRDYLGGIAVCLGGLDAYAKQENLQDMKSEIGKARAQILVTDHLFFSLL